MNKFNVVNQINSELYIAEVPGSKSYTNRALILAAYRVGITKITNALICDDTQYLATALNSFGGISVEKKDNSFIVNRTEKSITSPSAPVFMGGAGTPARFLLAFALTAEGVTTVTGNPRLSQRPMQDILDAFSLMGNKFKCLEAKGCLPIEITGGLAKNNDWQVSGEISSQFLSSLLLHASQQSNFDEIRVSVPKHLVSKPYVNMTLAMMTKVGLNISESQDNVFIVHPSSVSSDTIQVEVDASGMSYLLTAAVLTQSKVKIPGISRQSAQGDVGLIEVYEKMGCKVVEDDQGITLIGQPITGINVDMEVMPDVVLSLAVAASQASSSTKITNIANLRVKECDRIAACTNELQRLGVDVEEGPDWLIIHPNKELSPANINTYDDHRVAMAFSLLGLISPEISVEDPSCVSKSFPKFWHEMTNFLAFHQTEKSPA